MIFYQVGTLGLHKIQTYNGTYSILHCSNVICNCIIRSKPVYHGFTTSRLTTVGRHSQRPRKRLRGRKYVCEALIRLVTVKLHSQRVARISLCINHRKTVSKTAGGWTQSQQLYEPGIRVGEITASLSGVLSHVIG